MTWSNIYSTSIAQQLWQHWLSSKHFTLNSTYAYLTLPPQNAGCNRQQTSVPWPPDPPSNSDSRSGSENSNLSDLCILLLLIISITWQLWVQILALVPLSRWHFQGPVIHSVSKALSLRTRFWWSRQHLPWFNFASLSEKVAVMKSPAYIPWLNLLLCQRKSLFRLYADEVWLNLLLCQRKSLFRPVSYTHLTLPTRRWV